jgi:hypothetical protein
MYVLTSAPPSIGVTLRLIHPAVPPFEGLTWGGLHDMLASSWPHAGSEAKSATRHVHRVMDFRRVAKEGGKT